MKWTTALPTGAAILAAACSDGGITTTPPPPPSPSPAGVLVIRSERDSTLSADTLRVSGNVWLHVTGVDSGAAIRWAVSDSAVAGVLEKHFARLHVNARKVGNAVISASLDGRSGTFALVIQQPPDSNHGPVARVEGPSAAVEGTAATFKANASTDADHDPLVYAWSFADGSPPDSGSTVSHVFKDNGSRKVAVVVKDPSGSADTASLTVTVKNAAPAITALDVPTTTVALSDSVKATATVSDPGSADVLTITFDWGDGKTSSGSETHGAHLYSAAGTYTVKATVRDDDGDSASRSASVAVGQPAQGNGYDAVDLGTLGGQSARAADLNDQRQIVGTSLTSAGAEHAFLWDAGGMHDLGASGHDGSEAVRINNSGVIAGTVWTRVFGFEDDNVITCNIATIWRSSVGSAIDSEECRLRGAGGTSSYFGFFASPFRVVRAMNGSADVAWAASGKFGTSGWLWLNGSWQQLPSFPMAMNDRAQVVGARQTNESPVRFHAFLADGATARDLGVLAPLACDDGRDCSVAVAMDINASGQVAGVSTDGSGRYHFVLWDGAQIKDLGSADFAPGQRAPRVFINDRGEIAGSVAGKGFFWNAGGGAGGSLPSSGGSLEVAGLNEQGDVAGTILAGAEQHAFVWSQARGMTDLGAGGQGFSGAWVVDINERGDVVGYTAACVRDTDYSDNVCQNGYGRNPYGITGGQVRAILWRKK